MIAEGLVKLQSLNSAGCIVLGDASHFKRFGFRPLPQLAPEREPAGYFMILPMGVAEPTAGMAFHPVCYG